jgi:cyclic pyranopterin phosphate synthase
MARKLAARSKSVKRVLVRASVQATAIKHALANHVPSIIRPRARNITVAITAACNLRCEGCRYGRDFMPNQQIPMGVMRDLIDDAAAAGFESLRLYGGEPFLHPDLPRMVDHAVNRGVGTYVTTNGTLISRRIADLHSAGLRMLTIGFYGVDEAYDAYAGRSGIFRNVERGIAETRNRYGDGFKIRLNWLLMRPTASERSLEQVVEFARKYRTPIQVDLIHYSLPYFTEGIDRRLQFRAGDRSSILNVVKRLVALKRSEPDLIEHSEMGLWSIPDWLIKGPEMRVPCDKYDMLWVGADGTVQLCYVTFRLGNLHESRLNRILFSARHLAAARSAFQLECPNCHCGYDSRVQKHGPSRRLYGSQAGRAAPKAMCN